MENYLCDVTLVCEDKQIKAHIVIISSQGPKLQIYNKELLNFMCQTENDEENVQNPHLKERFS